MNILVIYQKGFPEVLEEVCNQLQGYDIERAERSTLDTEIYQDKDLVVVLGGDGTFLRASHYNKHVSMFGINPRPNRKEGFYMQSNIDNYKEKLQQALKLNTKNYFD